MKTAVIKINFKKFDLILVKKWDVADLQKGLEYAIQNRETLKWLSYTHVKEHFDRQKSIEKYYHLYSVLSSHEYR